MITLRITLVVAMMLALQMLPGLGWRVSGTLGWIRWALCVVQAFWIPACWRPGTCLGVCPNIKYDQPSAGIWQPSPCCWGSLIILGVSLLSKLGSVGQPLPELCPFLSL